MTVDQSPPSAAPRRADGEPPVITADWGLYRPVHETLRGRVRDWIARSLRPNADAWEAAGGFPREVFVQAGGEGLFGCKVAGEWGGSGPDFLADAIISEELASCGSGGVAAALGAHKDLGPYYIWRFGTDQQRDRWVVPAMQGRSVGALAVTEPGAGSDVAGIRTHATPLPGGDWLLNGSKTFITNGSWADVIVVAALTDGLGGDATIGSRPGHSTQTLFVVERTDPGFTARRLETLGWRTSCTGELSFGDVRLPADRVLGGDAGLGQGFIAIMRNFQWERIAMALAAVRQAEDLIAEGAALVAARAASRPATWVAVGRHRLGELAVEAAAARSLSDHALRLFVHGVDAVREVSMAKRMACMLAVTVAEAVRDLHGGESSRERARVERALRDARLGPIGGGTTQIMDEVIARTSGL